MNTRKRASPLVVLAIALVAAAVIAWSLPTHQSNPPADLRLTLLDGRVITLGDLRGRPVFLTFWATNCSPCIDELPDLSALYRELSPRGLELIAVAMAYDPPLNVQTVVRERALPYPVALDVDGTAAQAFNDVPLVPSAFVLDPRGTIVYHHVGRFDPSATLRAIAPFLTDNEPKNALVPSDG